jgi:hypothetical protein
MELPIELQFYICDFIRPRYLTRSDWRKGSYLNRHEKLKRMIRDAVLLQRYRELMLDISFFIFNEIENTNIITDL